MPGAGWLAHLGFGGCKVWLQDASPSQIESISRHLHGEGRMLVILKHPEVILEQPICSAPSMVLTNRKTSHSQSDRKGVAS